MLNKKVVLITNENISSLMDELIINETANQIKILNLNKTKTKLKKSDPLNAFSTFVNDIMKEYNENKNENIFIETNSNIQNRLKELEKTPKNSNHCRAKNFYKAIEKFCELTEEQRNDFEEVNSISVKYKKMCTYLDNLEKGDKNIQVSTQTYIQKEKNSFFQKKDEKKIKLDLDIKCLKKEILSSKNSVSPERKSFDL